jgi:predicted DNA-binding transcriptional regulator YafY
MSLTSWMNSERLNKSRRAKAVTDAGCTRAQLARLLRLVLLLQSERSPNAKELANHCEVSRRTIYRDLDTLAAAGVPVRYRPECEGYQIGRGFFLPPTGIEETEAMALLVLTRQWKAGEGLGLLRHAWGGALKLAQGLPTEIRERVLGAVEPFEPLGIGKESTTERQTVHESVLASLAQLRSIRVWFQNPATGVEDCTKFSPYRLLLQDGRWHMVGRSTLHRRVEVIGVPWVSRAVLTDDRYEIPPRFRLDRYLGSAWGVSRERVRSRVWLRFSAQVAPELNDVIWHRSQKRLDLADGRVELQFTVDGLGEILRWVLGFGAEVEILGPPELRDEVFRVATRIAREHRPRRRRQGTGVGG